MAVLTGAGRAALPDSAFAHIEPGHEGEKVNGKTPDKYRHYPVHDANHTRSALSRIAQGSRFGKEAKATVMAAAKKQGIDHDESAETGRSLESLLPEVRFVADVPSLEFRDSEGQEAAPVIGGYAAVFGKLSRKLGGFVEVIEARAFDRSRDEGFPGVVCRYNHRDDMVLGTTAAGTCRVSVDERGMRYEVDPPRSRADVTELIQRKDVRYSSFAFRCLVPGDDDYWDTTEWGQPLRHLRSAQVIDVAPVLDPAYFDTTAHARSMGGAVESLARWVGASPDEVRSYLAAGQAIKFFKRSDRPGVPPVLVPSPDADSSEARMLDDPAVALRNWTYDTSAPSQGDAVPSPEHPDDERQAPTEAELRAAYKTVDQLCYKYTDGEPCVRPDAHEGNCAGPCWRRVNGLPCHKPSGHEDEHAPMPIDSRSAGEAEGAETRETPEGTGPETRQPGTGETPQAGDELARRAMQHAEMEADLAEMRMRHLRDELAA